MCLCVWRGRANHLGNHVLVPGRVLPFIYSNGGILTTLLLVLLLL